MNLIALFQIDDSELIVGLGMSSSLCMGVFESQLHVAISKCCVFFRLLSYEFAKAKTYAQAHIRSVSQTSIRIWWKARVRARVDALAYHKLRFLNLFLLLDSPEQAKYLTTAVRCMFTHDNN